jgi:hypothetical protein
MQSDTLSLIFLTISLGGMAILAIWVNTLDGDPPPGCEKESNETDPASG